jgi:hypothetical protein
MIKKITKTKQTHSVNLDSSNTINLYLGHKNNHVQIKLMSPWLNFQDKNTFLTQKPYLLLPQKYQKGSRARRIITESETIIVGRIFWPKLFNHTQKSKTIAPQHISITLFSNKITITQLTDQYWTKIEY